MFWGLVLEPGKRYTKVVDNPFHISAAVLDTSSQDKDVVRVLVEADQVETLIANLSVKHGILQSPLDLQFDVGSQVAFYTSGGKTPVHLSGYVVLDEDEDSLDGEEEEGEEEEEEMEGSEDDEIPSLVDTSSMKRKADQSSQVSAKKSKVMELSNEKQPATPKDKNQVDFKRLLHKEKTVPKEKEVKKNKVQSMEEEDDVEEEEEEEEDVEEEEEDDVEEEEEEEEEEVVKNKKPNPTPVTPTAKKQKNDRQGATPAKQPKTPKQATPESKQPKNKKQKTPGEKQPKTPKQESPAVKGNKTPKTEEKGKQNAMKQKTPKQKHAVNGETPEGDTSNKDVGLPTKLLRKKDMVQAGGGVRYQDLVIGWGRAAKSNGNRLEMYYEGKFFGTETVFERCVKGEPLVFHLGRGEVIKGWDVGIVGMKVGGKRRIYCPSSMAYGSRGAAPHIPPNAELEFNVELKKIQM
ncbi:hypothetical protein Pmani_028189 [Petrolisthes manimaculis]|uniref:FK506-binding protein n=1 Tax=Petrolisthes manimaculis TaxID=1843537 RepID=A0AAE1TY83_9EUCA|nr:hypothetical protein Pmani_028189 [Petrolisthes manimaculis]